jgi:hypothetical protein
VGGSSRGINVGVCLLGDFFCPQLLSYYVLKVIGSVDVVSLISKFILYHN